MSDDTDRSTPLFVSVIGQDDNLGDSVLRRGFLGGVGPGRRRHVLVGRHQAGYLRNIGVTADDLQYTSAARWAISSIVSAVRRPTIIAHFTGEAVSRPRSTINYLLGGAVGRIARVRGGCSVVTGVGLRSNPARSTTWALRWLAGSCTIRTWRDPLTTSTVGVGETFPDWAYAATPASRDRSETSAGDRRLLLAVTFRGDRPPLDLTMRSALQDAAARLGLEICVVSQVRRDNDASRELAAQLSSPAILWCDDDHAAHERRVRDTYRRAAAVVSDRLHALIIGSTEGAVPVAFGNGPLEKAARSFDAVGMTDVAVPTSVDGATATGSLADRLVAAVRRPDPVTTTVSRAADRLVDLGDRVADLPRGRRATSGSAGFTVLQSVKPPDGTTRFVDQVVSRLPEGIAVDYLSARSVLRGGCQVFHLHWPEYFVTAATPREKLRRAAMSSLLLMRLRLGRVAVVRTLHNDVPHEAIRSAWQRALLKRWDTSTDLFIRLNPTSRVPAGHHFIDIAHGDYRERFAAVPKASATPGLVLTFGLIRKYKGIDDLVVQFRREAPGDRTLRVVGKPVDHEIVDAVVGAAAVDDRISTRFAFVPDDELVREVTSAEIVVLPYREMHNSGALLVALSLGRPVVAPSSESNRILRDEVGADWLFLFEGALEWEFVESSLARIRGGRRTSEPDLSGRDWTTVGRKHAEAYRLARHLRRRGDEGVGLVPALLAGNDGPVSR